MRRALLVFAASLLAGLVLLTPSRAAAAPPIPDCFEVDFAHACYSPLDLDFIDEELCDFPVAVHVSGWIRYRPFFAKDGSGDLVSDESHMHFRATIVNPATGRSFRDGSDFNARATVLPDGSVLIRETGILHNAVTDDRQRLFHQSGNHTMLIGPDDELIDEVFHGNWESGAAFPGKVCPILATPL
jgi:hypothetical protein